MRHLKNRSTVCVLFDDFIPDEKSSGAKPILAASGVSCVPTSAAASRMLYGICLLVAVATFVGCQSATSEQEVVLPDTISSGGETWRLDDRSAEEDERVIAYFERNPGLADHPGFAGEEVCYADGNGNHRYYWVSTIGESRQWILLEYRGSRAGELVEGKGAPFL